MKLYIPENSPIHHVPITPQAYSQSNEGQMHFWNLFSKKKYNYICSESAIVQLVMVPYTHVHYRNRIGRNTYRMAQLQ